MGKVKVKVGDVFQVPLPDGRFAYGRVYRDASVGIYREATDEPFRPPIDSRDFLFHVGLYKDILEHGEWPIIGFDGFNKTESDWPPAYFVKDVISGDYQIYHKGELRPAKESETKGLEEAAVWDAHHVVGEGILKASKAGLTDCQLNWKKTFHQINATWQRGRIVWNCIGEGSGVAACVKFSILRTSFWSPM